MLDSIVCSECFNVEYIVQMFLVIDTATAGMVIMVSNFFLCVMIQDRLATPEVEILEEKIHSKKHVRGKGLKNFFCKKTTGLDMFFLE